VNLRGKRKEEISKSQGLASAQESMAHFCSKKEEREERAKGGETYATEKGKKRGRKSFIAEQLGEARDSDFGPEDRALRLLKGKV